MMTMAQYIASEQARLAKLLADTTPLYLASQDALGAFSKRVFENGETISGSKYQYNSTDPLYVNPATTFGDTSALKPPRGKTGKTKFASTGLPHKTTWVESYKQLRNLVGREDAFVNFEAHGELKSDVENRSGGQMTPTKVNDNEYVIEVSGKNAQKVEGLNNRFPNVFRLSNEEKKIFQETYDYELLKLIKQGRP